MMQAYVASAEALGYDPNPSRHSLALPTHLESWPESLQSLSISQVDIALTRDEVVALGSQIIELGETFAPAPIVSESLIGKVRAACERLPGPWFVRLGSRSPKDAMYWKRDEMRANTPEEVIELLTAGSERVYEDLRLDLHFNHDSHIFLRQWIDLPEWTEFRCFMHKRRFIGMSQYYYRKQYRQIAEEWDGIQWAVEQFFRRLFKDASHLDSVVFDVFVKMPRNTTFNSSCCGTLPWRNWEVKLLEINPYWNLTDPCMFTWSQLAELEQTFEFNPGTPLKFRWIERAEQIGRHDG